MAHAFDLQDFAHIIDDVENLLPRTRRQERELSRLLQLVEREELTQTLAVVRDLLTAARQQHQLSEAIAARLLGGPANGSGPPHGKRVLVVDDLQDNRVVAATVLENAGFETITASNGLDAVIAAHCSRPDVILMDLTMPVLDGLEAARLIKASSATSGTRLLAYTARPEVVDAARLKLFARVLTKPASPEVIVRAVQDLATPRSI